MLFYIRRAIFTQTNPKKGIIEKKHTKWIPRIESRGDIQEMSVNQPRGVKNGFKNYFDGCRLDLRFCLLGITLSIYLNK